MTEPATCPAGFMGMKTHAHLSRCAGAAIAAVLAFGSTPTLAQGVPAEAAIPPAPAAVAPAPATPPMVSPVSPQPAPATPSANSAASPAPTITLPSETPAQATSVRTEVVSNPVVQQLPAEPEPVEIAEEEAAPPPARATAAPAPQAAPVEEPVETAAPVAPEPLVADAEPVAEVAPIEEAAPVAPPMSAETAPLAANETPVAETVQANESGETLGWIAAVLAALGLGGLALLGLTRRNRKPRNAPQSAAASAPAKLAPAVARGPAPVTAPVPATVSPMPTTRVADRGAGVSNDGAAVALPRSLPASFEERDALLRRMVAARPDRANPFRSPRARIRRARLILQSLGRKFDREPLIDLSQYSGNWPELARRDYATAA